ncbi:MAG: nuclease-related domain-containing protein, partial [Victivallaceae bacterium]
FGDRKSEKWTQQIFKCKNQFQNPFRQNYKHIMCLADLSGLQKENFTHIIVFVGDCQIKTRDKLPESLVTGGISLLNYIKSFSIEQFAADDLDNIQASILSGKISNTFQNKKAHVAHVKEIVETKISMSDPVCPK